MCGLSGRKGQFISTGIKKKRAGICFILPSVIGVLVFFILPFLDVVRRSVSNTSGTRYVGARNYMNVAQNEAFRLSVQNTARFLLISVPLLFLVSLLLAYYINTQIVRKGLVKAVLLFPMILPVSTTTLFCRILFDNAGILNGAFQKLGMDTLRLMDTGSVFWVLVALYFWKNIGFCVVLWSAAMEAIPKEIFEAARLDGAGFMTKVMRIILPLLSTSAFIILLLLILNSFKVFRESYMLAGNYPHWSIYMTQNIFNNWFQSFSIEKMAAGAVLVAFVMAIFVLLLQRQLIKKVYEK